jgi:hypothetical protein
VSPGPPHAVVLSRRTGRVSGGESGGVFRLHHQSVGAKIQTGERHSGHFAVGGIAEHLDVPLGGRRGLHAEVQHALGRPEVRTGRRGGDRHRFQLDRQRRRLDDRLWRGGAVGEGVGTAGLVAVAAAGAGGGGRAEHGGERARTGGGGRREVGGRGAARGQHERQLAARQTARDQLHATAGVVVVDVAGRERHLRRRVRRAGHHGGRGHHNAAAAGTGEGEGGGGGGRDLLQAVNALVQVVGQPLPHRRFHAVQAGHVASHLGRALAEARLELVQHAGVGGHGHSQLLPLHALQVLHRHLQDVGLLQFGVTRRL